MKKQMVIAGVAAMAVSSMLFAAGCNCCAGRDKKQGEEVCASGVCAMKTSEGGVVEAKAQQAEVTRASFIHDGVPLIGFETLKALASTNAPIAIVDARSGKWYDGTRIKGAVQYTEDFEKNHPDKNQIIVVYCSNYKCPASVKVAKELIAKGYTNVLDYKGGLQEWLDMKMEVEKD